MLVRLVLPLLGFVIFYFSVVLYQARAQRRAERPQDEPEKPAEGPDTEPPQEIPVAA